AQRETATPAAGSNTTRRRVGRIGPRGKQKRDWERVGHWLRPAGRRLTAAGVGPRAGPPPRGRATDSRGVRTEVRAAGSIEAPARELKESKRLQTRDRTKRGTTR